MAELFGEKKFPKESGLTRLQMMESMYDKLERTHQLV
jgi:hypothetical protein